MDLNECIMFKFYVKVFEDFYDLNSKSDKLLTELFLDTHTKI